MLGPSTSGNPQRTSGCANAAVSAVSPSHTDVGGRGAGRRAGGRRAALPAGRPAVARAGAEQNECRQHEPSPRRASEPIVPTGYGRPVQISPRYDGPPILQVDVADRRPVGPARATTAPARRRPHHARRAPMGRRHALRRLVGAGRRHPPHHDEPVLDDLDHIRSRGRADEVPLDFDPVATPAQIVDGMRDMTAADVLARYVETTDALADAVDGLDDEAWSTLAEAPPGHVAIRALALHALWDAWIHERDVVLPLGLEPVVSRTRSRGASSTPPHSVLRSMRRPVRIGAARSAWWRRIPTCRSWSNPVRRWSVLRPARRRAVSDRRRGHPCRGPQLPRPARPSLADGDRWLLGGLAEVFDVAP